MSEVMITAVWYLVAAMNIIAFILMGTDKIKAKLDKRRIPEKVLFLFAILFGAIGGTIGMYSFRHKTKHWYFAVFFPALAILQFALLVYFKFSTM